ncbi:cytochrome c peroxidase [Arsenicibacter rosenii]|nr:cytochrome c peroxidase [Arsenicibacter rosenii]
MTSKIGIVLCCFGLLLLSFCKKSAPALFEKPANFPAPTYKFAENPLTADGVALGKMLFYDALLSKDNTISCGSCHQLSAGFTQHGHALSHGINDLLTKRNSMPLFNLAWSTDFGWDGGVHHLDLFPLVPLQNPSEMDETLADVLEKLRKTNQYPPLFARAFGSPEINTERFLKALSQFMLTMVSADSRYDKAMRYEGVTLTDTEKEGLTLVQQKCGNCHSGELFTDNKFRNNGLKRELNTDEGRYDITLLNEDRFRFKVPGLRNLAATAPYMHDGRLETLEAVLDHYSNGVEDSPTLDPLLKQNGRLGIALTADEKQKILAFLQTLNDDTFLKNNRFAEFDAPEKPQKSQYANTDWSKVDLTLTSPALKASFDKVMNYYWESLNGLMAEDGARVKQSALRMLNILKNFDRSQLTEQQKAFYELVYEDLGFDAEHLGETGLIAHQRDHFGDLSKNLYRLVKAFHLNKKPLYYHFCPKAVYNQGGYWMTETADSKGNPFFGKHDEACGTISHVVLE